MIRKLALAILFVALGTMSALAATFSGTWMAQMAVPQGDRASTTTFFFGVSGATVTGKVTTPQGVFVISDGQIAGNTITFSATMTLGGKKMTSIYKGRMNRSGMIIFSRTTGYRPTPGFTAIRSN